MLKKTGSDGDGSISLLRLFVAIEMPQNVKEEIKILQRKIRRLDLFRGRYVNPEQAHLTVQFIGYADPRLLPKIKEALKAISFEPMTAHLGKLGIFFNSKNVAKVVWVEVVAQGITEFAHHVEKVLSRDVASRLTPFQSHVTLARIKMIQNSEDVQKAIERIRVEPASFTINSFVLKQSTLTAQGPVYVELETYNAK